MLRDKCVKCVLGLHNMHTQHKLLAEKALIFAKVQEIALAMKLTDINVQSLQCNSHDPVQKITEPQQGNTTRNTTHTSILELVIYVRLCAIIVAVLQNDVSKLNSAMCVVRSAIFQEYAARDYRMLLEGVDTLQI